MKHVLTVDQFSKDDLKELLDQAMFHREACFEKACGFRAATSRFCAGKILANLFYEPSTRTSSSFYSAMVRLGGNVIPINDVTYSSVSKGETLEDTIRTMGCYADVIALRHNEVGAADRAAAVSAVPIINAGDGIGEHPTQALLDLLTILIERGWNRFQKMSDILNGLKITMMGDLKHGRTVKSLAKLLDKFGIDRINWVSPKELCIPKEFVGHPDYQTEDLDDVITDTDVLYLTRIQKERFNSAEIIDTYKLTQEHMAKAKPNMVLMHPLPRVDELPTELDTDPRSAYFRQMRYGLFMRMAVLERVLENVIF